MAKNLSVFLHPNSFHDSFDGCIRRFLPEHLYVAEACLLQHVFQLLGRIDGHAVNDSCPDGVALYHFEHDGKLSARLQHTLHLLETFRQVRPEIDGLHSSDHIERPIVPRQTVGRPCSTNTLLPNSFWLTLFALATLSAEMSMP